MAVLTGLEPAISTVTGWRGLQLPYKTMALAGGVEPPHFGLTVRCPANSVSYTHLTLPTTERV